MNENKKLVYNGKYIQVEEETIGPNVWEKVHLMGGIVVYPFISEDEILLVQEYRPHEVPHVRIKPVTGIFEEQYDWKENANREMQEEIGYKANTLELLMEIKSSGTINNFQIFAVAKDLEESKLPNPDGEDSIQKVIPYKLKDIHEKLMSGEIPLRNSFLGIFKLYHQSYLNNSQS